MVEDPESFVIPFQKAGADQITFHIESVPDPLALIKKIKALNLKAGLSLRPNTSIEKLFPYLKELDLVLIMTVEPGAGAPKFLPEQADKVRIIKEKSLKLNPKLLIEVDGGIRPETAQLVPQADVLVSGNYIFSSSDYARSLLELKKAKGLP